MKTSPPKPQSSSDSDSSSDDDDEWTANVNKSKKKLKSKSSVASSRKSAMSSKEKILSDDSSSDEESEVNEKKKRSKLEEGELSSSSDSGASKSPDNDDSDVSDFNEEELRKEFDDGYNEEFIGDDEDRATLGNMTEKEREQELYNRLEKREALSKRFEIEKKLRQAKIKGIEEKISKRKNRVDKKPKLAEKSSPILPGKIASRTERRRNMEKNKEKKPLEDLMAERERKKNKAVEQVKKPLLKASDIYSDDDDEEVGISKPRRELVSDSSSSESDSDNSGQSDASSDEQSVVVVKHLETKEQLNKVRMTRNELGRYVHHPMFKEIVMGSFVRIGIGSKPDGTPCFRVCEVVGVCETTKVYSLENNKTNIGLRLRHGKQERVYRMAFMSNAEITENEYNAWKSSVLRAGLQLPTMDELNKKETLKKKHKHQQMNEADINHMVSQKAKFRKDPVNFALKKTELLKQKEMAESSGNLEGVATINKELEIIEERAEDLDKRRQENMKKITFINDRIKSHNLLKEVACKAEFLDRQQNVSDPFTRRRCAPVIVSNTKDGKQKQRIMEAMDKRYGVANKDFIDSKKSGAAANGPTEEQKKKDKVLAKDLFAAHDFDIKLDFPPMMPSSSDVPIIAAKASISNSTPNNTAPRRTNLNLDDYKKRRGLI